MGQKTSRRSSLFEQVFNLTYWVPFMRPGISVPGDSVAGDFPIENKPAADHDVGRLRRSLHFSSLDGICSEVLTAFTQGSVLTAWALYLGGGSTLFIGVLAAMPFIAQSFHLPAAWMTALFGRKRVTFLSITLARQSYWVLVPLPFLPLSDTTRQMVLLSVALVAGVFGVIGNNAWVSWMGDLVPARLRGRYFGQRNAYATLGGTIAALVAGLTIDGFKRGGAEFGWALSVLSLMAAVAGIISSVSLWRQHEPPSADGTPSVSLQATLRPFLDPAVRPFLTYQALWNFAVAACSSFIPVHMVTNLHMPYSVVAIHAATLALFRVLTSPLWGKLMDKVGARPILVLCSFGICSLPFIWLFPTESMIWPIFIDAFISGTLWAGHAVAIFALPFNLAPAKGRSFYLAAFTATGGIFFALASILAGALAQQLPSTILVLGRPMVNIHVLFLASLFLRIIAASLTLKLTRPGSVQQTVKLASGAFAARAARLGLPTFRR